MVCRGMVSSTYKPAEIETRCQKCGYMVGVCSCGDNQVLPERIADDFSYIRRKLDEVVEVKQKMREKPPDPTS